MNKFKTTSIAAMAKEKWSKLPENTFCRCFALFLFTVLITISAWITDDAYHGFSMSRNLVLGNGFVYNIGERVNASTMPLMSLVQALFFWISGNMFWSGIFSGLIFSTAAAAVVLFGFCRTKLEILFAFILLCCSKAFITFTTSGLENPLLFFLMALFVLLSKNIEEKQNGICTKKDFFLMGVLASLILVTRMDNILFLIPVGIYYFFRKRSKDSSFMTHLTFGLLGSIPFFAWVIFSTIYYGFPFPNTAYAKLGTNIPLSEYIEPEIFYFFQSFIFSPITIVWILFMLLFPVFRKRLVPSLFSLGILIYLVYLLRIGGDFMLGRHFTVCYFIGICVFLWIWQNVDVFSAEKSQTGHGLTILFTFLMLMNLGIPFYVTENIFRDQLNAADEREFYTHIINYLAPGASRMFVPWTKETRPPDTIKGNGNGCFANMIGFMHYYDHGLGITGDIYGLGDAFVTRCNVVPVFIKTEWRTGHLYHMVPPEYDLSLKQNKNLIKDPALHSLLDDIWLVVRGPIWTKDRFKAIARLNFRNQSNQRTFTFPLAKYNRGITLHNFLDYDLEIGGRWIADQYSMIQFRTVNKIKTDLDVAITGIPFCWPGMPEQTMDIWVNGEKLATVSYSDKKALGEIQFTIPRALVKQGDFKFEFRMKERAKSMHELGTAPNPDHLYIFVKTITLTEKNK